MNAFSGTPFDTPNQPSSPLRIDVVTIFPAFFGTLFDQGVVGRAFNSGLAQLQPVDPRSFATDRHRTVDDRPFGGGEGMVLKPEPLAGALSSLKVSDKAVRDTSRASVVLLSAQGQRFTQARARSMASLEHLVLICGRYEGVDERINTLYCDQELCIGDYVLSGGELAAAVVIDTVVRLLPGALGNADSIRNESFGEQSDREASARGVATSPSGGLLDYPHYTRPAQFGGVPVPDVLVSGDHLAIQRWRRQEALRKTVQNRPDLLHTASLNKDDQAFLASLRRDGS